MPSDFVNGFTSNNGTPSTAALTSTSAHPHASIKDNIVYSDEYANDFVSSTLPTHATVPYKLPVSPHHDTT